MGGSKEKDFSHDNNPKGINPQYPNPQAKSLLALISRIAPSLRHLVALHPTPVDCEYRVLNSTLSPLTNLRINALLFDSTDQVLPEVLSRIHRRDVVGNRRRDATSAKSIGCLVDTSTIAVLPVEVLVSVTAAGLSLMIETVRTGITEFARKGDTLPVGDKGRSLIRPSPHCLPTLLAALTRDGVSATQTMDKKGESTLGTTSKLPAQAAKGTLVRSTDENPAFEGALGRIVPNDRNTVIAIGKRVPEVPGNV